MMDKGVGEYPRIDSIEVDEHRVTASVLSMRGDDLVGEDDFWLICTVMPHLPEQVCVNGDGDSFGDGALGTSKAHLIEHVALELLLQMSVRLAARGVRCRGEYLGLTRAAPDAMGAGYRETAGHAVARVRSWQPADVEEPGLSMHRVSLTYDNDLCVIRALSQATALVRDAPTGAVTVSRVDDMVGELCGLYRDRA